MRRATELPALQERRAEAEVARPNQEYQEGTIEEVSTPARCYSSYDPAGRRYSVNGSSSQGFHQR